MAILALLAGVPPPSRWKSRWPAVKRSGRGLWDRGQGRPPRLRRPGRRHRLRSLGWWLPTQGQEEAMHLWKMETGSRQSQRDSAPRPLQRLTEIADRSGDLVGIAQAAL